MTTTWEEQAQEYFRHFSQGRYDPVACLRFIYTKGETHVSDDGKAFYIGRPGADGLEFAYRDGHPGIWIWYPIDAEWRKVTDDLLSLEQDWLSGKLKV
jgi:hypothetical protein